MTKTYNKVVINNETYIDLSSDTVEDSALLDGYTAHDRNGALITGNLTPVTDVEVDGTSVVTSGVAEIDLTGKANVSHTHTKSQITDFPSLATVATTGDYDDLTDKPTIPTLKNVFGKVKVGSTTIEADTTQDTLELAAGSNVTLTPDATNDKVTIAATDTTYSDFTGAASNTAGTHGLVPAPASGENHKVLFGDADWDSLFLGVDVTAQSEQFNLTLCRGNYEDSYTQLSKFPFPAATTHLNGLMSVSDKTKLDGIASGAEVNVQSDWSQSDTTADDYIKNKPSIPSQASDIGAQPTLVSGTNIKTINSESLLGSGDITVSAEPEVFIAIYGTTTYADVSDAVSDGKTVFCKYPSDSSTSPYYLALTHITSNGVDFAYFDGISGRIAWLESDSTWSTSQQLSVYTPASNKLARFDSSSKMNSTDMTSQGIDDFINSLSITGGGGGGGGSGTPTPTANATAAFDSNANMNSSDMTTAQVDTLVGNITAAGGSLIDFFYPVGSYYETSDSTFNPNITWGGTWASVDNLKETKKLLWTNTSLTAIGAETIQLDLSGYTHIEVVALTINSLDEDGDPFIYGKAPVGQAGFVSKAGLSLDNTSDVAHFLNIIMRDFYSTTSGVTFGNGQMTYNGSTYPDWSNRATPYKIFGIKQTGTISWHRTA